MEDRDREMLKQTLDALERLMRMFQAERILYLCCVVAAFGLLMYAGWLMFSIHTVTPAEIGLMFGATGVTAVSSGRVAFFLNKAFNLIEDIVRKLSGLEPRHDS